MRVSIVIASINELENMEAFMPMLEDDNVRLTIVDEGDDKIRKKNDAILRGIPHHYFGVREREEWFRERFGSNFSKRARGQA